MDQLTTLELKQVESGNIRENGDFTTILSTPIEITEGTSINISKVFIDSVSETQSSVLVPTDLNFTFTAHIYNVDWNSDGKAYTAAYTPTYSGKKMVACDEINTGQTFTGFSITSITFFYVQEGTWGGFTSKWQYRDDNNELKQVQIDIPEFKFLDPGFFNPFTIELSVLSIDGILTLISPSQADFTGLYNTEVQSQVTTPVSGNVVQYKPKEFSKTFLVKAGSYDPNFFAKLITDNLTENKINATNLGGAFTPVDNPFLFSSNILTASNNIIFVDSETGANAFSYDIIPPGEGATGGYWIGTNQMSLEFADGRFYWSNLHMPIYNADGAKIITFLGLGDDFTENSAPICANSGLIWSSIKTDSTDPKYINFFETILGFDDRITKAQPTFKPFSFYPGLVQLVPIYNWNRNNFTQGLNSIDVPVQKATATFYQVQNSISFNTIINDETQGIYAQSIYSQSGFSFGYYEIAINSIFKHMLVGTDIKRTISALVSRYYENNSYCTGNISDSINYVHKGDPVLLSSLDIRILDSNGKAVAGLGDDNSVYIQVIKPQQVQSPQPSIKDKKDK